MVMLRNGAMEWEWLEAGGPTSTQEVTGVGGGGPGHSTLWHVTRSPQCSHVLPSPHRWVTWASSSCCSSSSMPRWGWSSSGNWVCDAGLGGLQGGLGRVGAYNSGSETSCSETACLLPLGVGRDPSEGH